MGAFSPSGYWFSPAVWGFELFFRPWMNHRLGGIHLAGIPDDLPDDRAVILASNHVSWWDGFLLREVHRRVDPGVPLFTLMGDEERNKRPFFRALGVVGLDGDVGTLRRAIRTLRARRKRGPIWLSMFPQGEIRPSWSRPLGMRRGLAFFARLLEPAIVLPVAIHLEPLDRPGPTAFVHGGSPIELATDRRLDLDRVEQTVEHTLDRIHAHLDRHGEASAAAWPPADRPEDENGWSEPLSPVAPRGHPAARRLRVSDRPVIQTRSTS